VKVAWISERREATVGDEERQRRFGEGGGEGEGS